MATIVRMPGVLAGSEEASVSSWLVEIGARVEVGEPLAEVETAKANVEYAAEVSGILGRTLVKPGDPVEVGDAIAVMLADGEGDAEIDAILGGAGGPGAVAGAGAGAAAQVVGEDPDGGGVVVEAQSLSSVGDAAANLSSAAPVDNHDSSPSPSSPSDPSTPVDLGGRLFASPIARRLARERSIDIASVRGSGPGGRISRRDIEAVRVPAVAVAAPAAPVATLVAAAAPAAPAAAAAAPAAPAAAALPAPAPAPATARGSAEYDEVPHTAMRRAIARRLTESKSTVPHFYLNAECRVDALLALRASINEASAVRISVNDFVIKAVAAAFADVPEANVTWTDSAMRKYRTVDISVAVATDGGLVTPVLRDVGSLTLSSISNAVRDLAARSRDRKLRQDEIEGGSFSITNLGMFDTLDFAAILNPPQSGILAVGAARKQPVVGANGELEVGTVMRCTLSVDHRAVDGALAAKWLAAFTRRIENPLSILV